MAPSSLEYKSKSNRTPLMMAAWFQRGDVTQFLADRGADVSHATTDNGENALTLASKRSGNGTLASKVLLALGMDVNYTTKDGSTPLFYAVSKAKDREMVELYLERGANVNALIKIKNVDDDPAIITLCVFFSLSVYLSLLIVMSAAVLSS